MLRRVVGGDYAEVSGRDASGVPSFPFFADGAFWPPKSDEHPASPKERIKKPKPGADSSEGSPAADSGSRAMVQGGASRSGIPTPVASRPETPAGLRDSVASILLASPGLKQLGVSGVTTPAAQPASVVIQVGNLEQQGASIKAPAARPATMQSRGRCPKRLSLPKPKWPRVAAAAAMFTADWEPALLRALAVVVGFSKEFSYALSTVSRAGANATVVFTDIALQVTKATFGVAELAGHGIVLDKVTANVTAKRWYRAPCSQPLQLTATPSGEELDRMPGRWKQRILASLYAVSPALPLIRDAARFFDSEGHYVEAEFEVQLFVSDHVGVQFYHGAVTFSARGAKPARATPGQPATSGWKASATAVHDVLELAARVSWRNQDLPEPSGLGRPPVPSQWSWAARMQHWRPIFQIASGDGAMTLTSGAPRSSTTSGGTTMLVLECASRSGLEHASRGAR